MKIDIINLGDDLASVALRSILECWGCTVRIHHVATAQGFVRLCNRENTLSNHVVLMCHGVEEGIVLPELASDVEAQQPYHTTLTAANLRDFLYLPERLVLNTGCLTGRAEFAVAFVEAGCHSYIGPTEYPDGGSALFYVLHFFYELHARKSTVEVAHQKAKAHDVETQMFHLYQAS